MNCDYTSPGGTPLERLAQQQAGTHPAPCARSCEANAYQIEVRRYQAEVEQFRADARRFRIADKNLFDVQEAAKIIAKQAIAAEAERDALAAKLKEVDGRIDDLLATCHRLALKLECLLLDTKDSAPVSRWWDSAMAALDGWHKAKDAASARPVPAEPVNARLLTALKVCRHKFAQYVAHHISKGDMHKAMANESMVAMADVAIMGAEAAPRVARLTHPDIAKALASAGLKPEDYREDGEILPLVLAIESAALRKNGIEVSE